MLILFKWKSRFSYLRTLTWKLHKNLYINVNNFTTSLLLWELLLINKEILLLRLDSTQITSSVLHLPTLGIVLYSKYKTGCRVADPGAYSDQSAIASWRLHKLPCDLHRGTYNWTYMYGVDRKGNVNFFDESQSFLKRIRSLVDFL